MPYDDSWPAQAEGLRHELTTVLGEWLVAGVHHVGSTAVPGLAAKPIIDLMAGVASLHVASLVADRLARLSWHLVPPELDVRPWRRLFVKVVSDRRVAHLHLMQPTSERWRQALAFRDRLRRDPHKAGKYSQLKRRLAAEHRDDREGYSDAKAEFIRTVLRDDHRM